MKFFTINNEFDNYNITLKASRPFNFNIEHNNGKLFKKNGINILQLHGSAE